MNQIKLIKPVNKTAALVTNQSGCKDSIDVAYSHLKYYKKIAQQLHEEITKCSNKLERKELAKKITSVNKVIEAIKSQHQKPEVVSVAQCFIQICTELMREDDFNVVMSKAKELANKVNMK